MMSPRFCLPQTRERIHASQALERTAFRGSRPRMTHGMATTAALQISHLFIARSWRGLFLVMLVSLHLAAMWGTEDFWALGLMLAHFGLFILWQPFMRGEHRLTSAQVATIAAIALGTLYFLNWWLLALWVSGLAGNEGATVLMFQTRCPRTFS